MEHLPENNDGQISFQNGEFHFVRDAVFLLPACCQHAHPRAKLAFSLGFLCIFAVFVKYLAQAAKNREQIIVSLNLLIQEDFF